MWFKLLMLVHFCVAFPLKCPEPAQWALRANGHCADPSKYFCLKNDLINGYSENCTRSDFQQPGRKAVLRGGIDAEICSVERYQPFPIKFYTNVSTNCLFLKSYCNEEGQVVYDQGNRNTDTTCRCDYRRGYDFLVKPINPCFCKPSQEECSCYLKTCSNTSHILSPDFQCIYKIDFNVETTCRPITDEEDVIRRRSEAMESTRVEHIVSFIEQRKNLVAILIVVLVCTYGILVAIVCLKPVIIRLLWRQRYKAYFIDEPHGKIILYEGESFELKYQTSRRQWGDGIFKNGILVENEHKLFIKHVHIEDKGLYYAKCCGLRSKKTLLKVLPLEIKGPELKLYLVEGESLTLQYVLPVERLIPNFFKNKNFIAEQENIRKKRIGLLNVLTIMYVTPKDEGLYSVEVNTIKSDVTMLTVQSMFTSTFDPIYCTEGDNLQLKCTVYSETIGVQWFKDNMVIKENENTSINWAEKNHIITFKHAKVSDSGQYCIVAGNVQKQLTVTVTAFFKRPLKSKTIMEGLEVSFECEVVKPYPVEWYKDDKLVNPSSNIEIDTLQERVHKLTILQTTLENTGKYEIKINHIVSGAKLEVKEIPDAIKQMSEHDRSIFLKAAKNGTTVRYNIRIILVGKQGVGKTSLLRRLMSEGIEGVQSTDGINIEVKNCKIELDTKKWIFTKGNESPLSEYPNEQFADCGFWDFAGQKEFYATHQTFLSRNAIYLLVVDVAEDFKMNTFKNMIQNQYEKTGEYIDFWLDNIHCYTVYDTDEFMILKSNELNPPVIIIGTGMDKVEDTGKTKDSFQKYINELLKEYPKRKHLRKLCFLSNTKPSKDRKEFQTLRDDIFETAKKIPKWGDNLPTRWICLEKEIDRLIQNEDFVISYDTAKGLASKCSFSLEEVTLELDSFLKYEHEIGNLIFFEDIKSYIILEHKWLVDVFKCFVAPFQFQSQFINMPEWSRLQSTGHLPKMLIEKLFTKVKVLHLTGNKAVALEERNEEKTLALQILEEKKAFALEIMEKFDIIVKPITKDNNEEYYMPCMMEATKFNHILETFRVRNKKCSRTSWFGLQFDFLPPAYFNHILVTFLKKYSVCVVGDGRLAIYRGIGVFDLETSKCLKLVVCLSENSVALQVWQFKKGEDICYHENRKYLTQIVGFLQQKYRINIPYRCFLKCPDGTHHEIAERIYLNKLNDVSKTALTYCPEHKNHTLEELLRFWFKEGEDVIDYQKDNTAVKCHYCEKMPVYRCYECSNVLCDDCYLKHDKLTNTKHHAFQSTNDKLLLNNTFKVSDYIGDMKSLPGGLLVFVVFPSDMLLSDKLLTYSVSDKQRNEISVGKQPRSIAIVDRNTVVVLLSPGPLGTVDSIGIVDIRQRQVIQHVDCTLDLPSYPFCPMFYTDDQLYISNLSGITVMDMSGTIDRKIELGFTPRDMCYDNKATRIYCIDRSENKLICIDRDGNTIFTFTDTGLTNAKSLTIDNEGYVLILCHEDNNFKDFKIHRISPDGKSGEVIITGKHNYMYINIVSSICFQEESDKLVIGIEKKVYTYKNN